MKICVNIQSFVIRTSIAVFASTLASMVIFGASSARADETCSSPYLARIEARKSSSMFGRSAWKVSATVRTNW